MKPTVNGLLVIDKPTGITSRAAVDEIQRWLPQGTRIGHAGTLDPLATGVLVMCLGACTRLIEYVQRMEKVYRAKIRLGARSDTDDICGAITPASNVVPPAQNVLVAELDKFTGTIEQVPPAFSATHVAGRRAHVLARRGQQVQLAARPVDVHAIDIVQYAYPFLEIDVRCGKGTYIRSLARDLGENLGCGGLIQGLRRTRVGPFKVQEAGSLTSGATVLETHLLPMIRAVSELSQLVLDPAAITRLRQGQEVPVPNDFSAVNRQEIAIVDDSKELAAVGLYEPSTNLIRPLKVTIVK
jgi:tRNA pseudouridine55 synthase